MRNDVYDAKNTIPHSDVDGWTLGYIGIPWPGPWPKLNGDLFATDPTGWQVGLAWERKGPALIAIDGPNEGRWGVFQVCFPLPVMSEGDLIENFRLVLPLLKRERARLP